MRYAICNETFEGWDHARVCGTAAELGYEGLEIAPFTLAPRITDITAAQRRKLHREAKTSGISIIGLHWLLAKTEGLQLTSPEVAVRQRTADYLIALARCCRDLGGDLMVLGSPAQRRIPAGKTKADAIEYALDTFERALRGFVDNHVRLCLEPLSPPEADFINTCDEALEIIRRFELPLFVLHLDVKAMTTETTSRPDLIRKHGKAAGHFHANDANRRGPGFGDVDFVPIFQALKESGYAGWVSVEVFDYSPDPVTIARESIRYMRECEAQVR
jgi:sugar phosphate isomerase/epimerase